MLIYILTISQFNSRKKLRSIEFIKWQILYFKVKTITSKPSPVRKLSQKVTVCGTVIQLGLTLIYEITLNGQGFARLPQFFLFSYLKS